MRPKILTAATAILGLLPLLVLNLHGTEIERPLALPTFYVFVHDLGRRWAHRKLS